MAEFSFEDAQAPPEDQPKSFSFEESQLPPKAAPIQQTKKPEPEMPTVGSALLHGVGAGFRHTKEGVEAISGVKGSSAATPESPAAAPLEWSDVSSPVAKLLPKLAYGLGESAPELAGGIAGGAAGAMTPIPGGALVGGALGAGGMAALKTIAPHLKEELAKSPQDPDGAWSRAVERAGISGATMGASWGAFGLGAKALSPLKQIAFQALGIQPGISMAGQTAQNIAQGKPVDEGVLASGVTGAIGTAVPMAGHAALSSVFREVQNVAARRAADPILSRLGDPEDLKIGRTAGWRQKLSDLYRDVKDDLNPFKKIEQHVMEGQPIPAELSPYIALRLTRGSPGKSEHFVDYKTFDALTYQNNGPGLREALNPVKDDLEGFRKFLLSKAAIQRHARGQETGIPLPEAQQYLQQTGRNNAYNEAWGKWQQYHDRLLDYMVDSGMLGQADARRMRAAIQDYVPLHRLMDDPTAKLIQSPGQGLQVWDPIHGASGSVRKIIDPIETTVRNTYLFMSLADRNMALQKLGNLNAVAPMDKKFMQKERPGVHPITVTEQEVGRALAKEGITTSADPSGFTIFRSNAFRPDENHIRFFRDGKSETYRVDPRIAEAVNGLNKEQMGTLTKILAWPAKTLRAGATLSPEFIVRNPARDQFSAFIFSTLGRGYVPLIDLVKGAGATAFKTEDYQKWLKSGGANSAMVSIDRSYVESLVRKMNDPTFMGTVKNVVGSPIEALRVVSELMENATRVGEHMRLTKRGATPEAAAFASREVTLDFQRMGAKMQGMNSIVAFMNAQMEGVDRMFRSMKEQPLGFAAKVGAAVTLPSLYLWWANKDDPRMKEIPRWQKDMFWIIPTDNWQPASQKELAAAPKGYTRQNKDGTWEINKGNIYRIPKPFEIGVLFGSVPERILDAYYAKNPNAAKNMLESIERGDIRGLGKQLADVEPKAFKNVGKSLEQAFVPSWKPQFALPFIEQFANRSTFTERPLIPKYLENIQARFQSNPYTTDTAKIIGNALSRIPGMDEPGSAASPIVIENYVRAWTGGLGQHVLQLSDAALRGAGITPTPILPTLTNADKTGIKAFAVRFPEAGANSIQDFYEEFNKRKQAKDTATYLRKTGEQAKADEIIRENVLARSDTLQKALGAQMKLVRNIYLDKKMSPQEKRDLIDLSYLQMIKMAQTGNKMFQDTEDAFKKRKEAQ